MEKEYKFNDVPFNFVPLNHEVYIPEWGNQVSQDKPFKDGEDGIIRFTITNTTPMCVGMKKDDKGVVTPACVEVGGVKHYYIPASSIKGMLRSTLEILSFSKLQQYNDDFFGYRNFGGKQITGGEDYALGKMANVLCGWLWFDGKDYKLANCGEPVKTPKLYLPDYYWRVEKKSVADKCQTFKKQGYDYYPDVDGKRLVCSGHIGKKAHEYLFPYPEESSEVLNVPVHIVEKFKSVYKTSPNYDFINDMLKKGEKEPLAVFFKKQNGVVESIGITRMYRYPYQHRVVDGVSQTCRNMLGEKTDGKDLVDCIFGYVGDDKKKTAVRGRVQVGNAFAVQEVGRLEEVKGVLGQPKASFYPYYLKQAGSRYVNYDSRAIELSGRKRYRVHSSNNISDLPKGNDNENVSTTLRLVPKDNSFVCEIRVHNLRPIEIGALLSALTFHDHSLHCHHSIGMAKPMGYGRMEVSDVKLDGLMHDEVSYMRTFENCMSSFYKNSCNGRWSESEQLNMLFAIASDHSELLGYMSLDGYKAAKKDGTGKVEHLTEIGHYVNEISLLSLEEYQKVSQEATLAAKEAEKLREQKAQQEAEEARRQKEAEEKAKAEAEARKKAEEENAKAQAIEEQRQATVEAGLASLLEAKNINDQPKVTEFKQVNNIVETWIKKKAKRPLSPEELLDLQKTLTRVKQSAKKQDLKELQSHDGRQWKRLKDLIGDPDVAQKLQDAVIDD